MAALLTSKLDVIANIRIQQTISVHGVMCIYIGADFERCRLPLSLELACCARAKAC